MKSALSTLMFAGFLLYTGFSEAQQLVADTLTLKPVEVRATKKSVESNSAVPLQQLSYDEISRMPGNSAADAVRSFSGITVKDYGGLGGMKTVLIRSLGANHTGVFIDGAPVSDVATGQIDLGKIPLTDLETVELFVGRSQTLCLPARIQASAGILAFSSKFPELKDSRKYLKAGFKTGSFGLLNPFAGIYFKAGKSVMAAVTAEYISNKGNYPYTIHNGNLPDTTLKRLNADLQSLTLNCRINQRFADSSVLSFKAWLSASDRGLPAAVIYYNPYSVQRLTGQDFFSNVQYRRQSGKVSMLSNINISGSRVRYCDPAFLSGDGGLDNRYHQQEYYLSQAFSLPLKGMFSMGAAADVIINGLQTSLYANGNPVRYSGLASFSLNAATPRTEATATLLATAVADTRTGQVNRQRTALSPSVSVITRLSVSPVLRLRVLYKNSFRMPTFNDLYYNLVGNFNLKPETVDQLNIGLIFSGSKGPFRLDLHADGFANRVRDKIVAVPTQNLFVWSMRNLGKVTTQGLELRSEFSAVLSRLFRGSLDLNYTHQQALDMSTKGSAVYRQQIPYVPIQTFAARLVVSVQRYSVGYSMLYTSHQYSLGENIPSNLMPAWQVHDAAFTWQQPAGKQTVKIKAEILNLFNAQYEVIRGFPISGRGFYLSVSINY